MALYKVNGKRVEKVDRSCLILTSVMSKSISVEALLFVLFKVETQFRSLDFALRILIRT